MTQVSVVVGLRSMSCVTSIVQVQLLPIVCWFQSQTIRHGVHWEKHQRSHKQVMALFTDKPHCLPSSAVSTEHSGAIYIQAPVTHTRPLAVENEVFTVRQA